MLAQQTSYSEHMKEIRLSALFRWVTPLYYSNLSSAVSRRLQGLIYASS